MQHTRRRAPKALVLSRALTPVLPALLLAAASSAYGQQTITYTDGQNNTNPIALTADLTLFIDSGSATQSGVISQSEIGPLGLGQMNKGGNGTLVLAADNTYPGGTVVDQGTLQLSTGSLIAGFVTVTNTGTGSFPLFRNSTAVTVNSTASFVVDASTTVAGLSLPPVDIADASNGGTGVQVNAGGTLVNHGSINGGKSQLIVLLGTPGTGGPGVVLANGAASLSNIGSITGGTGLGGGTGGTGIWVQTPGTFSNNGTVTGGAGTGSFVLPTTGTGGTGLLLDSSATFNNAGTINGGDAGNPPLVGNGGNGGIGVTITAGGTLTNSGSIVGKAGGTGAPQFNGGNGGQGVLLTSGGTFTNERSGSVVGGAAGAAGVLGHDGTSAPAVELTAGGTVNNSGTISANHAVVFTGAAGTLSNSGTINGGVSMGNFANQVTLVTGGKIAGDLDMSSNPSTTLTLGGAGTQTYSAAVTGATVFAGSLTKQNSGRWAFDLPMTYSGNTSITNGTLALTGSASIPNSPVISVAPTATFNVLGLTNRFTLGQSQTLTGSGIILGDLNVAGTVNGDTTIHGDVALSSTGAIKGNTTITGTLSGPGRVDPGNSPGLVTAVQIDPSGGMAFNFELTRQGAPNFADPSNIGNDVLRLTGDDPFASALSSANAINLYLSAAAFNAGGTTDIEGGFFTDFELPATLAADVDPSLLHIFIADPTGTTTYNGETYSPLNLTQYTFDFTAVPQSAQFGAATANGAITDLQITTVPEPLSAVAGAALLGLTAISQRPRRRKAPPQA